MKEDDLPSWKAIFSQRCGEKSLLKLSRKKKKSLSQCNKGRHHIGEGHGCVFIAVNLCGYVGYLWCIIFHDKFVLI